MIRTTACILAVLLCYSLVPRVHADFVVPSERVRHYVSVRKEPHSNSPQIARLRVGTRAKLLSSVPFWHEVELESGERGFVSKAWTRVVLSPTAKATDELRINFFNVGPGTCTVVECPGENAPPMIIDCGAHWVFKTNTGQTAEEVKGKVVSILSKYRAKPNLVLSHGDYDHYAYLPTVLAGIEVNRVWQGGDQDTYRSKGFPDWIRRQAQAGALLHEDLQENFHNPPWDPLGDELSCGVANVYILTVNTPGSKNTNSLVLMIEYRDFTAIFTGDATGTTEDRIRANYAGQLGATLLVGSHHGARSHRSNSQEWVDAVSPKLVVFSSGYQFGHPKCDAVERYKPHLASAPLHPIQCDSTADKTPSESSQAEYMTEANGTVSVTTNGYSPMQVTCSLTPECNGAINH